MRALEREVERREHEAGVQQFASEGVVFVEPLAMLPHELGSSEAVHLAEAVLGLLDLVPVPHVAIRHAWCPLHGINVVYTLERHREALEAVRQLHGNRREIRSLRPAEST